MERWRDVEFTEEERAVIEVLGLEVEEKMEEGQKREVVGIRRNLFNAGEGSNFSSKNSKEDKEVMSKGTSKEKPPIGTGLTDLGGTDTNTRVINGLAGAVSKSTKHAKEDGPQPKDFLFNPDTSIKTKTWSRIIRPNYQPRDHEKNETLHKRKPNEEHDTTQDMELDECIPPKKKALNELAEAVEQTCREK
ncbi:hypothetical protein RIF29_33190 [Crotalaria pallida]|uniref:Uncharacterized protein n=1 Tax=Crotalaria pallida TaxID=3830 RepID=A0AAN9HSM1_CROPI